MKLKSLHKKMFVCLTLVLITFAAMTLIAYNEYYDKDYYTKITYDQLNQNINESATYMFFYKTDCIPCSKFKKKLNEYIKSNDTIYPVKAISIGKSDTDESIIEEYELEMSPTFVFYKNGKEIKRLEGNVSLENLKEFFAETSEN